MASISALRDGIAANLATIAGLRTRDTVSDSVSPPTAVVGPPETLDFDTTFARGADRFVFPVRLYVGRVSERAAQDALDAYLAGSGAGSVKAAIESDPSLGGVAHTTRVTSARGYGVYTVGDVPYLGCEWVVEVYASGS